MFSYKRKGVNFLKGVSVPEGLLFGGPPTRPKLVTRADNVLGNLTLFPFPVVAILSLCDIVASLSLLSSSSSAPGGLWPWAALQGKQLFLSSPPPFSARFVFSSRPPSISPNDPNSFQTIFIKAILARGVATMDPLERNRQRGEKKMIKKGP